MKFLTFVCILAFSQISSGCYASSIDISCENSINFHKIYINKECRPDKCVPVAGSIKNYEYYGIEDGSYVEKNPSFTIKSSYISDFSINKSKFSSKTLKVEKAVVVLNDFGIQKAQKFSKNAIGDQYLIKDCSENKTVIKIIDEFSRRIAFTLTQKP